MGKNQDTAFQTKIWKPKFSDDITFHKAYFLNYGFDKHVHEDYTIGLIQNGHMDAFVDGEKKSLDSSTIVSVNPDETHACQTFYHKDYTLYSIYLKPNLFKELVNENFHTSELYFKEGAYFDKELSSRFLKILNFSENQYLSNLDFECELLDSVKSLVSKNVKYSIDKNISNHQSMIKKAKEFMSENYHLDLNLDDISDALDVSKYHFLRTFKDKTFLSPHNYLMLKRIEKAKELLQKGETLTNTAHICGFNDQSHLNRRFKSIMGLTPGEYKKFFN